MGLIKLPLPDTFYNTTTTAAMTHSHFPCPRLLFPLLFVSSSRSPENTRFSTNNKACENPLWTMRLLSYCCCEINVFAFNVFMCGSAVVCILYQGIYLHLLCRNVHFYTEHITMPLVHALLSPYYSALFLFSDKIGKI